MRLILLNPRVVGQPHVVVDVEAEERSRLPTRLVHDQVVERNVLWQDDVLLDEHELVDRCIAQLLHLCAALVKKAADGRALRHARGEAVARAIPV
eukprot:CAMPEP_0119425494 /NCGR_PEP_ID=MMETSP1335-20130426/34572_1 /TAXON_ID=259385 /ORGANISM="Chrysoculter rhomboideus, Strain RCC1486" /LENGTH=94 /DNA_ID=CAMNT_0007451061 /DNA_START=229 /DNA_END=513 /DNA_ORIENTATION=+